MPAHRSTDEAEIREEVVKRLRAARPDARIIHEINVCQGGNRIDVLAVDVEEIIAVEVKSKRDKIDRLADQLAAMRSVAHHTIAALHEKFLVERPCNPQAAHYKRRGEHFRGQPPVECRLGEAWIYPLRRRALDSKWPHDYLEKWDLPDPPVFQPLPEAALDMLWRNELAELCYKNCLAVGRRATRGDMMQNLLWLCTGKELTRGICEALRARKCVEADPPISPPKQAKVAA